MSRKKNSILFYGIYGLSGILLLISVLVTGTYGLRKENVEVYDFELSEEEMNQIYALNQDYKYHPESLNCPGY